MIFAIHLYIHHATASNFAGKDSANAVAYAKEGSCAHALDYRLLKFNNLLIFFDPFFKKF